MPEQSDSKILILQSILNSIVETNSYHDDLSSKMDKGKQNMKLKQFAMDKIK